MTKGITKRSEDYSQWYVDIVTRAQLADYAPVKGCMVIRPNGYAIWERMQAALDGMFKETGHVNAYFPFFIPESFMKKEAEHVEGFAPLCAVVTHGGGKKLEEPLYARPTSETIIWSMYSKWIQSWRDLPLLYNQWCNIVRWEMRTRLFLRTTEFLWQEGHTAHASYEEAQEETLRMLEVYRRFAEDYMALSVLTGEKTDSEKFAGADMTYCLEAMMQDCKALQAGTSHNLGQNFARAFDVQFQDRDGELKYVYATSWGVSTRLVGALIMAHGDDQGLVLPPRLAPTQAVIVPIWKSQQERDAVLAVAEKVKRMASLAVRLKVDDRDQHKPGWKFAEWELQGVPLRLEIGPKEVERAGVVLVRRDTGEKVEVSLDGLADRMAGLLDEMQGALLEKSRRFREEHTRVVCDYDSLQETVAQGFADGAWCGSADCEERVQEDTRATIRCLPFEGEPSSDRCSVCGKEGELKQAIWARAY